MNKRYAAILVLLAVIVGAAALFTRQHEQSAQPALAAQFGQPLLKKLKANEVASIVIRAPKATLTLTKKDNRWTVAEKNGFPADLDKVRKLVVNAIELRIGQVEPIGAKDRAHFDLLDPAKVAPDSAGLATALTFKAADGRTLAELLVGKKYYKRTPSGSSATAPADGRYVMLPDNPKQVFVVSDPLRLASAFSAVWISKDGFAVHRLKTLTVKLADGGGYKIERSSESVPWKLAQDARGARLDASKANAAVYDLANVAIDDVATGGNAQAYGFDHPTLVTATTFDGLTYILRIGRLLIDRYPLHVEIDGTPRRELTLPKDLKPAAKTAHEKSFAMEMSRLNERVAREKTLSSYVLLVAKSRFTELLKKESELLQQKAKKKG
jgi:Domain of unknown function (DUF4340)